MNYGKEYPATHSMATSWFGVDKDGNVALIEFEDNGPVPYGCEDQCISDIIESEFSSVNKKGIHNLNYTIPQGLELEKRLKVPSLELLEWDNIVKIDVKYRNLFIELCNKNKDNKKRNNENLLSPYAIINEVVGLYMIDFGNWCDADKKFLIDNNIIFGICDTYIDNATTFDKETKEEIFTNEMTGLPFYLYQQPYSPNSLTERTYIPRIPYKATQLPEEALKQALLFPFSFKETPYLQIAEYFQCDYYFHEEDEVTYDGIREILHKILPSKDGNTIKIRETIIGDPECRQCGKCTIPDFKSYRGFPLTQYGLYPTILHLTAPMDETERMPRMESYSELFNKREWLTKIFTLPIIPGIPLKSDSLFHFDDDLKAAIEEQDMNEWFSNCRNNFEKSVSALNPRGIIASENANEIIRKHYSIANGEIKISESLFPYYIMSENSDHLKDIMELSQKPYRGICPKRIEYMENEENL